MLKTSTSFGSLSNGPRRLLDKFNRKHDYLRISITDRCNLRCTYCMPPNGIKLEPKANYLNLAESKRLAEIFVKLCGITKIRLTGGEPSIDSKLVPMLEHANGLREFGLKFVGMTTNGLTLRKQAKLYKDLGLDAINISLDTLQKEKYEKLSRFNGFNLAYEGLMEALNCGFERVKLNCVLIKGFNDDEILAFIELAKNYPIDVRFIEFMPFEGNSWTIDKMIPYKQIVSLVLEQYPNLKPITIPGQSSNEISKVYKDDSLKGSIGFISSMSENFCSGCNRLRLTADGHLKVCLFGRQETSLRDLIRNGGSDLEVVKSIESSLLGKKRQHAGAINLLQDTMRPMVKIESRRAHHSESRGPVGTGEEVPTADGSFSHLDQDGRAKMVDVGQKPTVKRFARAEGRIFVGSAVLNKLGSLEKGDALSVAKVAGIMGAKMTSQLIPMCHQIPLNNIEVDIKVCPISEALVVTCSVQAEHRTGVEMECLTAVSVTLLTLYDMCKSVNKSMKISDIGLVSKRKLANHCPEMMSF